MVTYGYIETDNEKANGCQLIFITILKNFYFQQQVYHNTDKR